MRYVMLKESKRLDSWSEVIRLERENNFLGSFSAREIQNISQLFLTIDESYNFISSACFYTRFVSIFFL